MSIFPGFGKPPERPSAGLTSKENKKKMRGTGLWSLLGDATLSTPQGKKLLSESREKNKPVLSPTKDELKKQNITRQRKPGSGTLNRPKARSRIKFPALLRSKQTDKDTLG